ncbi:MAG: asparagine synthase [Blastocatellia bacterium]|nr:asparagine synthase [Blastocatellia bacterium]
MFSAVSNLFHLFRNRSYSATKVEVSPKWWAVVGSKDRVYKYFKDAAWQDESLFLFQSPPSFSPQKRFILFGEIWLSNREKLLQKLPNNQHLSDLELVAWLWEMEEFETLQGLQGMFAFCVWDAKNKKLHLVRDKSGAQTLYYNTSTDITLIAPRLRTVANLVQTYSRLKIDTIAVRDFLCSAFVPGERTMWEDTRELRPATVLTLPEKKRKVYWEIQERVIEKEKPLKWHADRLRKLLEEVVTEYLPQKEPVGIYLSGGLDSSAVVALAKKLHNCPIHTFSIHFGNETPNELQFSSLVAQHCKTEHNIIEIKPEELWGLHAETLSYLDDPVGDPLTVPNLIMGRAAREVVQVILNGEGGDPCFGGPKNQPMLLDRIYNQNRKELVENYLASFQKCFTDLPKLFKTEFWREIQASPYVFEKDLHSDISFLNRLMFINTKFKGADHILTKVSNLTRASGIEGRSPLFDQRIVDLSLEIPPIYKLNGAEEKAVLKEAVRDILPEIIINRPKSGMMVPVQLFFRKYWQAETRAVLHKNAKIFDYLNYQIVKEWINYQGDTWGRYGVKLWLLVTLELWLQVNKAP